jgi:hypothetical protein
MSYSFTVFAANKEEARAKVAAEFDSVEQQQPVHRADRAQAEATASSFIDLCEEPAEDQELSVRVAGSINWDGSEVNARLRGAGISVTVGILAKRAVPA